MVSLSFIPFSLRPINRRAESDTLRISPPEASYPATATVARHPGSKGEEGMRDSAVDG
jgi:hypothetical protein